MGFDQNYVTDTGSIVRIHDGEKGDVTLHFVNACLTEEDLSGISVSHDESGRHTRLRISNDAAELLSILLNRWWNERRKNGNT